MPYSMEKTYRGKVGLDVKKPKESYRKIFFALGVLLAIAGVGMFVFETINFDLLTSSDAEVGGLLSMLFLIIAGAFISIGLTNDYDFQFIDAVITLKTVPYGVLIEAPGLNQKYDFIGDRLLRVTPDYEKLIIELYGQPIWYTKTFGFYRKRKTRNREIWIYETADIEMTYRMLKGYERKATICEFDRNHVRF